MIKSTLSQRPADPIQAVPAQPPGRRRQEGRGTSRPPLERRIQCLHYFLNLLESGYQHALHPDPLPRSLRGERIALGIDVPELDTVPFWSTRRTDGAVAIAFIEFIVAEICGNLRSIADAADPSVEAVAQDLAFAGDALQCLLEQAGRGSATSTLALPHLDDVFLSRDLLEVIFGPNGLLAAISRHCDALMARGAAELRSLIAPGGFGAAGPSGN